jgi:hypothetical protein
MDQRAEKYYYPRVQNLHSCPFCLLANSYKKSRRWDRCWMPPSTDGAYFSRCGQNIYGYHGRGSQFKQNCICTMGISHPVVYGTLGEKHLFPMPHTTSSWTSCTLHKGTTILLPVGALGEDLVTLIVRN